jgi:ABC-type branched-subunit amino acid transport system substrate-binding protein
MSLRPVRVALSCLTFVSLVQGCSGNPGNREQLQLGAVLSTTGDLATIGTEQLQAVTLAIEEINAAGGVLGKDLTVVNRDDGTNEAKGATAAKALADLGVPVVFGATGSAISLKVGEVLLPAKIVQVSFSSTSPLLTSVADDGYLFRTCPSDALQGKLLARRARAKGFTKVAVIHLPGAYGKGLADAFAQSFVEAGGTAPTVDEYTEGAGSYTTFLSAVYAKYTPAPDAILLVAYPVDGAQIIKDYNNSFTSKGTFWFFTDATEDPGFYTGLTLSFGHEGTGPGTPTGEAYDAFRTAYQKKYGQEASVGSFAVNAYDAVYLVALGMEAAQSASAADLKAKLTSVSSGGTAFGPTAYADAVKALKAGTDINFQGASGVVDFDAAGDVVAPYHLWKVEGGAIQIVSPNENP